ncbi:hypothetical protein, partial [Methylophilus sp.]|uniref:hypothetical protein n=1 Tax=Methylophilus sp. TaxID=29541 RepID=UPI0040376FC7
MSLKAWKDSFQLRMLCCMSRRGRLPAEQNSYFAVCLDASKACAGWRRRFMQSPAGLSQGLA